MINYASLWGRGVVVEHAALSKAETAGSNPVASLKRNCQKAVSFYSAMPNSLARSSNISGSSPDPLDMSGKNR